MATVPYTARALDASTWDAFAELVERNGGIRGSCWCTGYHRDPDVTDTRAAKQERVRTDRAHAALVFDAHARAQGWAQYGNPEELPGVNNGGGYLRESPPRPDWRITCIFVDKRHRGQGVARVGFEGALDLIAQAGGGLVEAVSHVTAGRKAQGRFLFSATVELFEQYRFQRGRQIGKHAWIVSRVIDPA